MNNFFILVNKFLISLILSLSATVIYAEVSSNKAVSDNATNKTAVKESTVKAIAVKETAGKEIITGQVASPEQLSAWQLHAEQWELARSGETILSLPVLNQLVQAWLYDKQKKIEIQYPGGEDGELWVQELTDWLVSLGLPSKHMVITPGSGADDVIKFNLRTSRNASF